MLRPPSCKEMKKQRLICGEVPDDVREMLGLRDDEIVRIKKAGYGLVNAPWKWFKKVEETLLQLGWKQHPLDVCLFMKYSDGELSGVIGIHVDGALTCGHTHAYHKDMEYMKRKFKWGHWHEDEFTYCGLHVIQEKRTREVYIDLEEYCNNIKEVKIDKNRLKQKGSKMTPAEITQCRAVLGQLQWCVGLMIANLACQVSMLQGQLAQQTIDVVSEINKTVKMLSHCADLKWRYFKISDKLEYVVLGVSSDAAWANRPDLGSQGGWMTFMANKKIYNGDRTPIVMENFSSKKTCSNGKKYMQRRDAGIMQCRRCS